MPRPSLEVFKAGLDGALPPQQHPNGWQMETPCPRCHGVREGKDDALRPAPPHLLCWEEAAVLLEAAPTAPSLPTGLSAVPG